HYFFCPSLQHRFHFRGELIGERAIDQAVIEGEREIAGGADGDSVVDDHGLLHHAARAEDRDLRLVDYGRCEDAAETTEVGNGERSDLDHIRPELAQTGS